MCSAGGCSFLMMCTPRIATPGLPYSKILKAVRRDAALAAVGVAALGIWVGRKLALKLLAGAA